MRMEKSEAVLLFINLFGLSFSHEIRVFVSQTLNWSDAQKYCRNYYGDLATVTVEDLQLIQQDVLITQPYMYIGLQRDLVNHGWLWSDGSPASINEWDVRQGTTIGEDCGAVRKGNGKLHDFPCSMKLPFFCMTVFNLVSEKSTWEEAYIYCTENNTTLAITNSSETMSLVANMALNAQTSNVWIGLRFLVAHWFWVDGGDMVYTAWSSEADRQCPALNQRCGALDGEMKIWNARDCEEKLSFVCHTGSQ